MIRKVIPWPSSLRKCNYHVLVVRISGPRFPLWQFTLSVNSAPAITLATGDTMCWVSDWPVKRHANSPYSLPLPEYSILDITYLWFKPLIQPQWLTGRQIAVNNFRVNIAVYTQLSTKCIVNVIECHILSMTVLPEWDARRSSQCHHSITSDDFPLDTISENINW